MEDGTDPVSSIGGLDGKGSSSGARWDRTQVGGVNNTGGKGNYVVAGPSGAKGGACQVDPFLTTKSHVPHARGMAHLIPK